MKVTIKFFPHLNKVVGANRLERDVPANISLVELLQDLRTEFPQLAQVIPNASITLNRQVVDLHFRLREGDEVALFPPVSGG